jgi:hypothetical protein
MLCAGRHNGYTEGGRPRGGPLDADAKDMTWVSANVRVRCEARHPRENQDPFSSENGPELYLRARQDSNLQPSDP